MSGRPHRIERRLKCALLTAQGLGTAEIAALVLGRAGRRRTIDNWRTGAWPEWDRAVALAKALMREHPTSRDEKLVALMHAALIEERSKAPEPIADADVEVLASIVAGEVRTAAVRWGKEPEDVLTWASRGLPDSAGLTALDAHERLAAVVLRLLACTGLEHQPTEPSFGPLPQEAAKENT